MIIRQSEPLNLETPFEQVQSFLTPTDMFYVRCHFAAPKIDLTSYQLRIDGAVRQSLALTYSEIRALPSVTITATLECAGNSRVFLVPQTEGAQWGLGAVGNAEWTGVLLSTLLDAAALQDDARDLIFEGADSGTPKEEPVPPAPIVYARSLDCAAAVRSEILLAYQMNGHDLPQQHGFPLRAIVPGHYGMASVKWLTRIHAATAIFNGYWQTSDYAFWDRLDGKPVRRPLGEVYVKSEIARPVTAETIPAGASYLVCGAAWAGAAAVAKVELSANQGQTWREAELLDPIHRHSWRRWQWEWSVPRQPGAYTLLSRATDSRGAVQPAKHDCNFGSYIINHILPIHVTVR